jgi:hypothetical protein
MITGSFPGVESGRGMTLTPHPFYCRGLKNGVELYLYSLYEPSWPVKSVKPTSYMTTVVYTIRRLPKRRYAAHKFIAFLLYFM